jgi:cytochrome c oxidase cbb3-type subunit 3
MNRLQPRLDTLSNDDLPGFSDFAAAKWIIAGMLGLVAVGFIAYLRLRTPLPPASPEVASDPLLLEGRSIYLGRCMTCHGMEGRGDGPIASYLLGPPVGNLSNGKWKHGEQARDVMAVISKGVDGTRMAGWGTILESAQLRAVTAYVYHLAHKPVPEELRKPSP